MRCSILSKTNLSSSQTTTPAPRGLVLLAFAAIYLIWGSTYLGIRFAVESIPPFMLGGGRFLFAGGLLYLWLRRRGAPGPSPADWKNALIAGTLLLGIGNGGVNWAEQRVPSSLVALVIAITPLWFVLFESLRPGGAWPNRGTVIGLVIGFGGLLWLIRQRDGVVGERIDPAGLASILAASVAWALGSIYSRYTPKPEPALMGGALQMLAGGSVLMFVGIISGEADRFSFYQASHRSLVAFTYLTLIGSLVGFTAYSWLLKVSTPARVSTYAYVNPVIALFLGRVFGGELLTPGLLLAAAIILAGVIIISTTTNRPSASKIDS